MACNVAEGAAARDGSRLASIFAPTAANTDVEDSAAGSIAKKLCMDPPLELSVLALLPLLLCWYHQWSSPPETPTEAIACWKSLRLDTLPPAMR